MDGKHDSTERQQVEPRLEDKAQLIFDRGQASRLMAERGIDVLLAHTKANVSYIADYYYDEGWPDFLLEDGESYYAVFVGVPQERAKEGFIVGCFGEQGCLAWRDPWIRDRRFWGARFQSDGARPARPPAGSGGEARAAPDRGNPVDVLAEALLERGLGEACIGAEMRHIQALYLERLQALLPRASFVDAEPVLWQMRMRKSAEEVSRLRVAARAASRAAEAAFKNAYVGMSELDMERIVAKAIVDQGCRYEWLEIGFGPKGALTVSPTSCQLQEGHIIRLDIGASYRGYISDISRVAAFGKVSARAEWAHGVILRANQALFRAVRPGARPGELRQLVMNIMNEEGLTPLIPMAGHGLGRGAHEPPFLLEQEHTILEPGMVITVEPTIRLPGVGSVNIEDVLLVTEDGAECLSTAPRGLYDYI